MKERLLVLAKAAPEISRKFEQTVCVAGLTEGGDWRRIYPIPWRVFWNRAETRFKKKTWIEYETESDEPSDHRPESRKIDYSSIRPLDPADFNEIEKQLGTRLTTIEGIEEQGTRSASLGVVKPVEVMDYLPTDNVHYRDLVTRKAQVDLFGKQVVQLDIPKYKYRYRFKDDEDGRIHETLCEDWEAAELYRHCDIYRRKGKYKDEDEVHEKVRQRMLIDIFKNDHVYFIIGSHYRFNTYMIVGVIYPKKSDFQQKLFI